MFKNYFKKADIVLLLVLVVIGIVFSAVLSMWKSDGAIVVVKKDGELFGTYPLSKNAVIDINGGEDNNTLVIEKGKARISEASCKNDVCVEHAPISKSGEVIICLPNKVIVTIEGGEKGDGVDAVSS